jgi:tRNA(Ile2) C34 agmatinyltransferase TiaS
MVDECINKKLEQQHSCNCDSTCREECIDDTDDIEVVEFEDENGEIEEFVILEEVDFEDRHFAVMAPLNEVQAYSDANKGSDDKSNSNVDDLSIEIFEVKDDEFTILDDEIFAERLLAHLDDISVKLEKEGN